MQHKHLPLQSHIEGWQPLYAPACPLGVENSVRALWPEGQRLLAKALERAYAIPNQYLAIADLRQMKGFCLSHRDVLLESFHLFLTENDSVVALTDGLWLPGAQDVVASLRYKCISLTQPYFRKLCQQSWLLAFERTLIRKGVRFQVFKRDGY